jgi:chromosome segregation ATPase
MLFLSYFTNLDLQGTIIVRDEEAIKKLEDEKAQLEVLLAQKEKIVLEAQQQNEMITNKYSHEIALLLKNQKETQVTIQELNKKANGYSKKIIELQITIKDQTPQTHTSLQSELQGYEILNEELNRKVDALEAQLRDANQKAAQLFNWLKDVSPQDPDLNTKLDDAIAEVHRLIAIKVDLEEQIAELKRQNNDLTVYMHWLHSQLKKTSVMTTKKVVKKIVSPREVEPLVDVLKLTEGLINENVHMLENMTNEFKQVKLDTVDKLQSLLQS